MFFFKQFETFDPLSGYVPSHPFTHMPDVALRARKLLMGISNEKLMLLAEKISDEVESYFQDEKDMAINALKNDFELNGDKEKFENFLSGLVITKKMDNGNSRKKCSKRWMFLQQTIAVKSML